MSYYYEGNVQECINAGSEFKLKQSNEIKHDNGVWYYRNWRKLKKLHWEVPDLYEPMICNEMII